MENGNDTSLSQIVELAASGSKEAAEKLADFFLDKVNSASKRKLAGKASAEDQEDIAMSALRSFCIGIRERKYKFKGNKELVGLLHRIVDIKIQRMWQKRFTQKRDIRLKSSLESEPICDHNAMDFVADTVSLTAEEQLVMAEVLSELQADLQEMFKQLFSNLSSHPRRLLLTMLESDGTIEDYSKLTQRSRASVERYQKLIRDEIRLLSK